MGAICGILGRKDPDMVRRMAAALRHRGPADHLVEGANYAVAASHPIGEGRALVDGIPRDASGSSLHPDEVLGACRRAHRFPDLGLRGSFAAAVALEERGAWWLLRDRLGQRPLYYCSTKEFVLFASELKALLASDVVERRLNLYSVDRMLTLGCIPGSSSIVDGVCRVRPGHVVEYRDGRLEEHPFSGFDLEGRTMPKEQAADRLRSLLRQAVNRYETDDLLWASGIDSAAVAALRPNTAPLFVVLDRAWQDETKLAKESARLLRLRLHVEPAPRPTVSDFRKVVYHLDEPVADASVLPLWSICEQAAAHGSDYLTGFAADELLGGYSRYRFLQMSRGAKALVPVNQLGGILPSLPPNAFVRRGGHYLASIRDSREAYLSLLSVFDQEERAQLYTKRMKEAVDPRDAPMSVIDEHFTGDDLIRNVTSLDLGMTLPDLLLAKCDRMGAAHGVRLHFPYLDDDLVDFVVNLDPGVKYGVRSKPLLRTALKGPLPARVRLRARRGFKVPQGGPVYQIIEEVVRQTLTRDRVQSTGLFEWRFVEEVCRSATHNVYRRRQFWALLMLFAWHREYMES